VLADEVDAAGRAGQPDGRRRETPGEGGDGGGRFLSERPAWFDGADLLQFLNVNVLDRTPTFHRRSLTSKEAYLATAYAIRTFHRRRPISTVF
jgi:hypothetical protein